MAKYKIVTTTDLMQFYQNKTPIWAVAYDIDNDTLNVRLRSLPTKGQITKYGYYSYKFTPFNKKGELRKSGEVHWDSRAYADTEEEAIELYNELVQDRINELLRMAKEAEADFIPNTR